MSTVIQDIEAGQMRKGLPSFAPGDRVRVHFLVIEGSRKRPQVFEGVVIKRQGSGSRETVLTALSICATDSMRICFA